ncbi:MAG TPA: hypothetical protein VFH46_02180 [Pyrinomonadaceae bacterium]|nr:hypothetical protein [Pyrinomonadaceae bacterium]
MKPVKNLLFVALLLSGLAFNTFAGDIQTPGYVPPPPPPAATSTNEEPVISTDGVGGVTAETSDYFLIETLAALLSVY